MKRKISHFQLEEPALERLLQTLRLSQTEKLITNNSKVLDLGCGYEGELLKRLSPRIKYGVGYDVSVRKTGVARNITLREAFIDNDSKFLPGNFDFVLALAVLEHINHPQKMLTKARRALKRSGTLILTTPSPQAKPILEFLALKLGLISKQEILDHKRYFDKNTLLRSLVKSGFKRKNIKIKYFELGMNILAIAKK